MHLPAAPRGAFGLPAGLSCRCPTLKTASSMQPWSRQHWRHDDKPFTFRPTSTISLPWGNQNTQQVRLPGSPGNTSHTAGPQASQHQVTAHAGITACLHFTNKGPSAASGQPARCHGSCRQHDCLLALSKKRPPAP